MQEQIELLSQKMESNVLRITGLNERENENKMERVKKFFQENLEIDQEIILEDAFRVGKGRNRPMIIHLKKVKINFLFSSILTS